MRFQQHLINWLLLVSASISGTDEVFDGTLVTNVDSYPHNYSFTRESKFFHGSHDIEFKCTGSGLNDRDITEEISFFVDTTAPTEFTIDDSTSFLGINKERTYRTDRLNVSFSAEDAQSDIDYYAFRILSCGSGESKSKTCGTQVNFGKMEDFREDDDENHGVSAAIHFKKLRKKNLK